MKPCAPYIKRKQEQRSRGQFNNRVNGTDGFPAIAAPAAQKQKAEDRDQVPRAQVVAALGAYGRAPGNGQAVWNAVDAYV